MSVFTRLWKRESKKAGATSAAAAASAASDGGSSAMAAAATAEDAKSSEDDPVDRDIDKGLEGKYKKEIEDYLAREAKKARKALTVLLIGPGESGKTTFMKQIARIHHGKVPKDTLLFHKENIRLNIVEGMVILCEQSRHRGGDCTVSEANTAHLEEVLALEALLESGTVSALVDLSMQTKLDMLWEDPGIQVTYSLRHQFETRQVPYHLAYLMSRSNAIWLPDYVPSYDDYLKVRVRSTGVVEEVFWSVGTSAPSSKTSVPFKFVDVGGQRAERRKWMRVFDAEAALYVFGIGDYDLCCFEDGATRRMDEAIHLFAKLCNTMVDRSQKLRFFDNKSLIVFFNKWDVLNTKLKTGEHRWSEYAFAKQDPSFDVEREADPEYIFEYMSARINCVLDKHKPKLVGSAVHFHRTRATSIKNAQKVMREVQTDILHRKMTTDGLI